MGDRGADTTSRIAYLAAEIARHSDLYYNAAVPEISDAAFDALWDELKRLDPEHPQLQRVGAEVEPGSVKVDHRFPMRSLDKGTTDDDIKGTAFCQCQRGFKAVGPGVLTDFSWGIWGVLQHWHLFPAACGAACSCKPE